MWSRKTQENKLSIETSVTPSPTTVSPLDIDGLLLESPDQQVQSTQDKETTSKKASRTKSMKNYFQSKKNKTSAAAATDGDLGIHRRLRSTASFGSLMSSLKDHSHESNSGERRNSFLSGWKKGSSLRGLSSKKAVVTHTKSVSDLSSLFLDSHQEGSSLINQQQYYDIEDHLQLDVSDQKMMSPSSSMVSSLSLPRALVEQVPQQQTSARDIDHELLMSQSDSRDTLVVYPSNSVENLSPFLPTPSSHLGAGSPLHLDDKQPRSTGSNAHKVPLTPPPLFKTFPTQKTLKYKPSSSAIRLQSAQVSESDFTKVKLIGRGDVGKVYLVVSFCLGSIII
jgi:hypothetical protein